MSEIKIVLPSDIEIINGLEKMVMSVNKSIGNLLSGTSDEVNVFKSKIKVTKKEIIAKFNIIYTIPKRILIQVIDLLGDRDYSLSVEGKKLILTIKR